MSKNLKNINIPGYGDIDVNQISTGELAKYNPELEHKDLLYIASDTNNILYNNQQLGVPTYKATEVFFDRIGHYKIIKIDNLDFDNLPAIFYVKDYIEHYSEVDSHLGDVIVIPIINETGTYAIAIRPTIDYSDSTEIAKWIKCTYSEDDPIPYFSAYSNYSNFGFRKVVTLDNSGKIPSSYLPSYVDDVLEYSTKDSLPKNGEYGKIYVTTDDNKTYRWSSSTYIEIGNPFEDDEINGIKTIIDHYPILYNPQSSGHFYFLQGGEDITLHVPYYDPASKEIKVLSGDEQKIHAATTARAGVMTATDKSKLDSIEVEKLYTSDNLDLSGYVPKTEFDTVKTELDTLKAEFAKFKEDTTTLLNDLYNIVKTN